MPSLLKVPRLVTTPKVSVSMQHVRDGLNGRPGSLKGLGGNNLKSMSLDKVAGIDNDAHQDLVSTGLIGAIGSVTTVLGSELAGMKPVQKVTSRLGPKMRLGLIGGGVGLLGDYGALRASRALSGASTGEHEVKNMNKVASILLDRAAELRQSTPEVVALAMLKQAGMSDEDARYAVAQDAMEKIASTELTYQGIDAESAAELVKAANIDVRTLSNVTLITEEEAMADLLEKAAGYINLQAEQIEALELGSVHAAEAVRAAEADRAAVDAFPEQITKMASIGALTFDDIEALKAMPSGTLSKIASAVDQPWEFGKAAGISNQTGDPILDFCLG